ncbi:rho GTPase-activating protein 18 [Caerostris extrusa]|uniref:Rho GTPase-activating protein 18 n=1 Tax=Caerostris extrusa TaxID=172846 RepID=A0AAV4S5Y8_CAEEX|nr:rho GTPase-activating protein 18 [Caerostris extrusa]
MLYDQKHEIVNLVPVLVLLSFRVGMCKSPSMSQHIRAVLFLLRLMAGNKERIGLIGGRESSAHFVAFGRVFIRFNSVEVIEKISIKNWLPYKGIQMFRSEIWAKTIEIWYALSPSLRLPHFWTHTDWCLPEGESPIGKKGKDNVVFGASLSTLLELDRRRCPGLKVPLIFQWILHHLYSNGLREEGLMRLAGSVQKVQILKAEIERSYVTSPHWSRILFGNHQFTTSVFY